MRRKIVTRAAALKDGKRRYYDGHRCPRGHLSDRLISNYTCIQCLHEKHQAKRSALRAIVRKERELANAEMHNVMRKQSGLPPTAKHAEAEGSNKYFTGIPCKRGHIVYRWTIGHACAECVTMHAKRAYYKNLDRTRKIKAKRAKLKRLNDGESMRKQERDRRTNDVQHRIRCTIRARIKAALRSHKKNGTALKYLGCTIAEARTHIENLFQPGMSWENHTHDGWHIDHIKPLAAFNMTNENQRKLAFHYTNLQPLWATENMSKGARHQARDTPRPA